MKAVPVVIPYLAAEAAGDELLFAVEGWRRHFKAPHFIVIVGDYNPVVASGDVLFLHCPRISPVAGQYLPHLDHVNKLRYVYGALRDSEGFLMVADDCFAVKDFDLRLAQATKTTGDIIHGIRGSANGFRDSQQKTIDALKVAGLPIFDFTTHLPRYHEWNKLLEVFDRWDCDHNSYVIEDLYFNLYHDYCAERYGLVCDRDLKGFVCSTTQHGIGELAERRVWLNSNPDGWHSELPEILRQHYF